MKCKTNQNYFYYLKFFRIILVVDLENSEKLEQLHEDYAFAPKKGCITHGTLIQYCKIHKNKLGITNEKA